MSGLSEQNQGNKNEPSAQSLHSLLLYLYSTYFRNEGRQDRLSHEETARVGGWIDRPTNVGRSKMDFVVVERMKKGAAVDYRTSGRYVVAVWLCST